MAKITLELDTETFLGLAERTFAEERPIDWQAGVILRIALGLPFPRQEQAPIIMAGAIEKPKNGREKAA